MRIWKKNFGWIKPQEALAPDNMQSPEEKGEKQPLSANLEVNLAAVRKIMGNARDLAIREFTLAADDDVRAAVIALGGMASRDLVNTHVLNTLMLDVRFPAPIGRGELFRRIKQYGISNLLLKEDKTIQDIIDEVISGNAIFLMDGVDRALSIGTRGWKDRSVAEPITEGAVRGPRDGFTETIRNNTALIRRRIKSPDLRIDGLKVGERTLTDVMLVYLEGVAKKEIVEEVKKRLQRIKIDGVLESGYLEELIEDNPRSPFPQIEHSERPDKVAAAILEGRIAILVDTTPFVLMIPTVFTQFIQASEDYYERYYLAALMRIVRIAAYILSMTLPAVYIALTSFHQEMIPTPLALSIAASREGVPFPAIGEALIMEATFEILREAGIRLPRPTGQAVSIVGALVIGEAAVQAGIVSQAMVIIVALTGISSFAIPAFNAAAVGRLLRFPLMILASILGLFGILAGLSIIMIHMCSLRSFGVNYLDPLTSADAGDYKDVAVRKPWWAMLRRPSMIAGTAKKRLKSGLKPGPGNSSGENKEN